MTTHDCRLVYGGSKPFITNLDGHIRQLAPLDAAQRMKVLKNTIFHLHDLEHLEAHEPLLEVLL